MQALIDMPDEKAERFLAQMRLDRNFRECKVTLLPKGHGRLIDESKIKKCGWNFIDHHAKTDAPTIIEADKDGDTDGRKRL